MIRVWLEPETTLNNPYGAPSADLTLPANGAATYDPHVFAVRGRIGRLRYIAYGVGLGLLALLLLFVVGAAMGVLMVVTKSNTGMTAAIGLAYLPMLAVMFILARRRLNDMGHSGWLSLLLLVPLVQFGVWLWLMIGAGDADENQYGRPPGDNTGLVIAGACAMPLLAVAMIGILAAIAIPAYEGYRLKAEAAKALSASPHLQNRP